jgi:hypothetical protein
MLFLCTVSLEPADSNWRLISFCFFVVLGFELRAYTRWAISPAHFLWWVIYVCMYLFILDRASQTSCPGWLRTVILLISASWVARIYRRECRAGDEHLQWKPQVSSWGGPEETRADQAWLRSPVWGWPCMLMSRRRNSTGGKSNETTAQSGSKKRQNVFIPFTWLSICTLCYWGVTFQSPHITVQPPHAVEGKPPPNQETALLLWLTSKDPSEWTVSSLSVTIVIIELGTLVNSSLR